MFKTKYRIIIPCGFNLYQVQSRRWFSPFWYTYDEYYTTKGSAEEFIHEILKGDEVVYEYP